MTGILLTVKFWLRLDCKILPKKSLAKQNIAFCSSQNYEICAKFWQKLDCKTLSKQLSQNNILRFAHACILPNDLSPGWQKVWQRSKQNSEDEFELLIRREFEIRIAVILNSRKGLKLREAHSVTRSGEIAPFLYKSSGHTEAQQQRHQCKLPERPLLNLEKFLKQLNEKANS